MADSNSDGAVFYDVDSYYSSANTGNNLKRKTGTSTSGQVQRLSVVPEAAVMASNDASYYGKSNAGSAYGSYYVSNNANNGYSTVYANYGGTTGANKSNDAISRLKSYYNSGSGVYAAATSLNNTDAVAINSSRSAYTKPTEEQLNKYYENLEKFLDFDTPMQLYNDLGSVEQKLSTVEDSLSGCYGEVFTRAYMALAQYKDYIQQARDYVSKSLSPVTEKVRLLKGLLEQRAGKEYEVVDALEDQPFYYLKDSTNPEDRQKYEELAALYTPRAAIAAVAATNKEELDEQINTLMKEIYDLSDWTFYERKLFDSVTTSAVPAVTTVDKSEIQSLTSLIETRYSELASKGYSKTQILTMLSDEIKGLSKGTDTAVAATKSISSSSSKKTTSDTEAELQRIYDQLKTVGESGTYSQKETFDILDDYVKSGKKLSSISQEDLDKVVRLSSYTN